MSYVYIITQNTSGYIFGVYASPEHAQEVFNNLCSTYNDLSLKTEKVLTAAAHYPQ